MGWHRAGWLGVAVAGLGAAMLAGHHNGADAAGLILGGGALLATAIQAGAWLRTGCGGAVLALGVAELAEDHFHSGPVPAITALGFLLFGAAAVALARIHSRRAAGVERWLTWLALASAVVGVFSYFLHLELLFAFHDMMRPALPISLGQCALDIGLWLGWRQERWNRAAFYAGQSRRILSTAALVLVIAVVAGGCSSFLLLQHLVERDSTTNLSLRRRERIEYIQVLIREALGRGLLFAQRPELAQRLAAPHHGRATPWRLSLPPHEFSAVVLYDRGGEAIARYGIAQRPMVTARLPLAPAASLLWTDGFYLRQRIPIVAAGHRLGELEMEQPLPLLGTVGMESAHWGQSGEIGLCGRIQPASGELTCFPQRLHPQPFDLSSTLHGTARPMTLAVEGQTGVTETLDYRGEQVLAAYAPVPGLGLVAKMDAAELFAPVRHQLELMAPLLLALIVAGLEILRWQVQPLVRQLVASRNQALTSEARFRAAAESDMDPFFIFECVREPARGAVVDFRLIYANRPGEIFAALRPGLAPELGLATMPELARAGSFLEKFRRVAASRRPIEEEFQLENEAGSNGAEGPARWLHLQAVALGDGVAVRLRDISQRKWDEGRLLAMAQTDALTGLANRYAFRKRLGHAMESSRRLRRQALLAVLYLDIDHFKQINDTWGHAQGDRLLEAFAARLRGCVRAADTVARLGGDEFAILLENLDGADDAERVVAAIFAALGRTIRLDGHEAAVTTSIGMAFFRGEAIPADELLRRADAALYTAKRGGRNRWRAWAA